ncbi:M16 family metallopeptidase [Roseivirga pacifica]|uniref:M16 family metallopeptidase n=1 Tax=Roseivirga pacifica TaxID=1267423 RepID=UPI002095A661|nr:pitrilysin family protein [Roseivirga pacifica]MCO6358379.1 insulinase family protein [Roseivirga pacifica]MCO6366157.1 insulinase family protein [Roseivirga pacifica]MCO6369292.1 insulinase family protein [Roseivirga pacifica]MCO6378486.1 insulinase family protein [Roseivirga pacifica]
MKKLFTLAMLVLCTAAFAQVDRSKLPEPAEAREIEIGDYDKFTLKNGLTVIVVENDKLPTLSWTLSFDNGTITEGKKAGYTSIFGQVMRAGTTSKSKEVLNEEIDFMGASVNVGSSSISAFSLSKYKEDILSIFTDILYNPAFPQDEFDRAIEQTLTGLKQSKDNPDAIMANVRGVVNYGKKHVFGEIVTEETIGNIELQDLKNHYIHYFKPNIAYLVVVGDIKTKEAKKLVEQHFGNWEIGEVLIEDFKQPEPVEKTTVSFVDRPASVQSVINITYPIDNKPGSDDVTKLSLLNTILGGGGLSTRLNMNLREDKGYTYGAYSSMGSSRYSATFNANASVRNEVTDSAMVQFMYELNKISTELVSEEEFELAKNTAKGSFARSLESRGTVASFALNTEINDLPEDYYANYLKRVDAITREDLLEVAKKYVRPDKANIIVVGKADEVADKLKQFGEITYYDAEGNVIDVEAAKAAVASVDAQTIINKYLEAVGGVDKIKSIEDITTVSKATIQGQQISITQVQKGNIMSKQQVGMAGMVLQEMIFNNGEAVMKAQGQSQQIPPGPQLEALKEGAVIFPEQYYGDLEYELTVKGIQKVQGKDAYEVSVKTPAGTTASQFFDVESGLLVKQASAQGGSEILEYTEVNGIKVPSKMTLTLPGMGSVEATVEVKINTGVEDSAFSLN